jgi:uncharacterized protein (DUF58 family)
MPQPLIDALDVAVNRLVSRALPGDRRASGVGLGTELAQLRPYVIGDDVRHIDPSATARTGQPHVRLHVPERAITTWLVLDVSPSMAFGTGVRLKADVAEGVALVFARLGVRRTGSVAMVAFGASSTRLLPPRGSRPGLSAIRRALSDGVSVDGVADAGGLAGAVRRVAQLAQQPGLVVVISDFRDQHAWERPIGSLRIRHAVAAVEIVDPRESQLPSVGHLRAVDPETGQMVSVDTSRTALRQRFAELESERRALIARELRRLGVDHLTLSTDGNWLLDLGRQLR